MGHRCLTGAAGSAAAPRSQHARSATAPNAAAAAAALLQVPPKLAMSLLKDKDLKQKLKQYYLPTTGKRQVTNLTMQDTCPIVLLDCCWENIAYSSIAML